jgi:cellulose synthase/poly-beta-1,6-N-acetylglucosamine synthase-like glycosyltransferase
MDALRLVLWVLLLASLATLPYFGYLLIVSLAALTARRRRKADWKVPHLRFLVSIPAHDEEVGVAATVRSCLGLRYPRDLFEVLVIADNCRDQTAALARREGATVLERSDPTHRSKGHAILYMCDHVTESVHMDRLDAVVIIDLDTVVDPDLLMGFTDYLDRGYDWIQAFDTVANTDESWRTRLMTWSFGLINGVLLLGQTSLGLSGGFRGNGMCFSTRGLSRFPWRCLGLVEDLEYSWSLRVAGERIAFAREVSVHATMLAKGGDAATNQRKRWETGRSQLRSTVVGPLLRSSRIGLLAKMAALIDLTMPTMVALVSLLAAFLLFSAGFPLMSPRWGQDRLFLSLLVFTALEAGALLFYGALPFFLFSLRWNVLLSAVYFPIYAIWKLTTVFPSRPTQWIRTPRERTILRQLSGTPPFFGEGEGGGEIMGERVVGR